MGREIAEKGNKPGQIYEGQFSQDKKNGYGRYIYFDGDYYEGMFKDGKKSGWGTYQWGNG